MWRSLSTHLCAEVHTVHTHTHMHIHCHIIVVRVQPFCCCCRCRFWGFVGVCQLTSLLPLCRPFYLCFLILYVKINGRENKPLVIQLTCIRLTQFPGTERKLSIYNKNSFAREFEENTIVQVGMRVIKYLENLYKGFSRFLLYLNAIVCAMNI